MLLGLHGAGKHVRLERITNDMQSNNADPQSINNYNLHVPGDLRSDKIRNDETNNSPHDYDFEALSNCSLDLSCCLSGNAVNMVSHSLVEHKNQFVTFLNT